MNDIYVPSTVNKRKGSGEDEGTQGEDHTCVQEC